MEATFDKQIKESIISIIQSENEKKSFISFYSLLEKLSVIHDFAIETINDKIGVKGTDGYRKICTIYHLLKEMEEKRVIMLVKNDNGKKYEYDIVNDKAQIDEPNGRYVSGDLKTFLLDNLQANVLPSLDFEWFKKYGFKAREHVEAEKQTNYSFFTLVFAFLTFLVSIFAPFSQFKGCCTCIIICSLVVLIIGIILVIWGCKWKYR